tara:strand:- start:3375 stop:4121 length:747 start_codon:yes stop_codon:yes gene_type:complete
VIRAISFDLFDTLVDLDLSGLPTIFLGHEQLPSTVGALYEIVPQEPFRDLESFAEALSTVDRDIRKKQITEGIEISTKARFERFVDSRFDLKKTESSDLVEALRTKHMELFRQQVTVPAHHTGVLKELGKRFPLFVCSNFTDSSCANQVLRESNFTEYFQEIVISDDVGIRKPRKEIFDVVIKASGFCASEILHVGDNLEADVRGAKSCAMQAAWITRQIPDTSKKLRSYNGPDPDFKISDLGDLLNF